MGKQIEIDGHLFDEKIDGMTLVDAYYIPDEEVEQYRKDREHYAEKATEIFSRHCHSVRRDFKGSQDGEAIIGSDASGEITLFVHLDPTDIAAMKDADANGELEAFLISY